jgi:hypothetical protein
MKISLSVADYHIIRIARQMSLHLLCQLDSVDQREEQPLFLCVCRPIEVVGQQDWPKITYHIVRTWLMLDILVVLWGTLGGHGPCSLAITQSAVRAQCVHTW